MRLKIRIARSNEIMPLNLCGQMWSDDGLVWIQLIQRNPFHYAIQLYFTVDAATTTLCHRFISCVSLFHFCRLISNNTNANSWSRHINIPLLVLKSKFPMKNILIVVERQYTLHILWLNNQHNMKTHIIISIRSRTKEYFIPILELFCSTTNWLVEN